MSGLKRAKNELAQLDSLLIGRLMKMSLITANAIIDQALDTPQSIGAHYLEKDNG